MNRFSNIQTPHGITTRIGGVSEGVFGTMNTSFFGIDDPYAVFENIKRAIEHIGADAKKIIATQQVHSNNILVVDAGFDFAKLKKIDVEGTSLCDYELYVARETDGLLCSREDVVLMTFYADCVPLVFYDPVGRLVCTVHSGWRGTANLIGQNAISKLLEAGSALHNIYAGIGHCAGVCCYEVDEPVIEAFRKSFSVTELKEFVKPKENGKYQLDLKMANFISLRRKGLLEAHIEVNQDCTICDETNYHSHRRTGYPRGSMSAFIQLK